MVAGLLLLLGAISHSDAADPPTTQEVQSWFSRAWKEAQSLPDLHDHALEWTATDYSALLDQHSGGNATENIGAPQTKPAASEVTFFLASGGDRAWRFGLTFPGQPVFVDTVYSADQCWRLSTDSLHIQDPSRRDDKTNPNAASNSLRSFYVDLSSIVSGGFGFARLSSLVPDPVSVQGDHWSCDAHREVAGARPFSVRYEGVWLADQQRGRVITMRVLRNTYAPRDVDSQTRFSEWVDHPEFGLELATTIEKRRADGNMERSLHLDRVSQLPAGGLAACLIAPTDGHDQLRGTLSLKSLTNEARHTVTDLSTGTVSQLITPADPVEGMPRWRIWAYAVLGVSTIALVVGRIIRARRTRRSQ